jgi:hypothetical protein
MKREEQILPLRLQLEASRERMIRNARDRDRALARTGNTDVPGPLPEDNDFGVDDAVEIQMMDLMLQRSLSYTPAVNICVLALRAMPCPKRCPWWLV